MRLTIPVFVFLCFFLAGAGPVAVAQADGSPAGLESTLILAAPDDAYYPLAEEMAVREGLPVVHALGEALVRDPVFLLWVVSPGRLSDRAMVEFGQALRDRSSAVSVGIISGQTLEDARGLWLRASEVRGDRIVAVNAENPAGHIEAKIATWAGEEAEIEPLTKANLLRGLQNADYLTFTGHGGGSYLRLDESVLFRAVEVPRLPPAVVATASCNTFRPWEADSLPLALVGKGAAAYAGFSFSPNAGYLIGAYQGVPFRYTWPDFPIGHAVQVQNRGTLQGFAQWPYYWLLGDPRIALQAEAAYRLVESQMSNGLLTLSYADAPAGVIPVRIAGGARFSYVEIPGVSAAWDGDPFYNARLQMANVGDDKFVLFEHQGGDFRLRLRVRPPWYWVAGDVLGDALDDTLLYVQQSGGDAISLAAAAVVLAAIAWLVWRKKVQTWPLATAVIVAAGFTALHGLYALVHLDRVTITSKQIVFSPLSLVATFLLVGCGSFLFLNARTWRGRLLAIVVASFHAFAPAVFGTGVLAVINLAFFRPRVGTSLYNYSLGLQPLVVLLFEGILFGLVFSLVRRQHPRRSIITSAQKEAVNA